MSMIHDSVLRTPWDAVCPQVKRRSSWLLIPLWVALHVRPCLCFLWCCKAHVHKNWPTQSSKEISKGSREGHSGSQQTFTETYSSKVARMWAEWFTSLTDLRAAWGKWDVEVKSKYGMAGRKEQFRDTLGRWLPERTLVSEMVESWGYQKEGHCCALFVSSLNAGARQEDFH